MSATELMSRLPAGLDQDAVRSLIPSAEAGIVRAALARAESERTADNG